MTISLTLIVRMIAAALVASFIHMTLIPSSTQPFGTDYLTTVSGLIFTFCTGTISQILVVYTTPKFLHTLQKLEDFDTIYPPDKQKRKKLICCSFLTHNLVFLFFTITIPISVIAGILLFPDYATSLKTADVVFSDKVQEAPILALAFFTFLSLLMESASACLFFQLAYFVTAIENRFQMIQEAIVENTDSNSMYDLFLDFCAKSRWANKKIEQSHGSDVIRGQQFWKKMCKRYLDFDELFSSFISFAGTCIVVIYPLQIFSTVCMLYIMMTNVLTLDQEAPIISLSLKLITGLGIERVWSLSSIGYGIEQIHSQILKRILAVDTDMILDANDKHQVSDAQKIGIHNLIK
ncbi:unnamed protein product [Orchesella dallaii]|uniref:Odorant receptor n=1 Tax=Orchesella dallaii TaxID=48710 RepID=A0ABP1RFL5_9HEXA